MTPTPDQLRELLKQAELGQREAARILKRQQIIQNERQFRHYLTGKNTCPNSVYRALRDIANELSNT